MKACLTLLSFFLLSFQIFSQEENSPSLPVKNSFERQARDLFKDSLRSLPVQSIPSFIDLIDKSSLLDIQYGLEKIFSLPADTSYYMRRIVLLSMANNKESQLLGEEYARVYKRIMSAAFMKELKRKRPAAIYSGTLDPFELFKGWKKELRAQRVREIIAKLNYLEERDSTAKRMLLIQNATILDEALRETFNAHPDSLDIR